MFFSWITHQITCPHTPKQNGIVEHKHGHIIETSLNLMSQANIPFSY